MSLDVTWPSLGHARLAAFVGDWRGPESLRETRWQKPGEAEGIYVARPDLGGQYVLQDYTQLRGGAVAFEGRGVFAYDQAEKLHKLYWFDSLGFAPPSPASGRWEGDALTLRRPSKRGIARHVYEFDGADRYVLRIGFSADGGGSWSEVLTGNYARVGRVEGN